MVHTTIHLVGGPLDGMVGDSPYAGSYVLWFRTHAGGPTDLAHGRRPRTGAIAYHRAGQAGDPLRYVRGTRHGRARLR